MALTKTEAQVLEWTILGIAAVLETGTIDVSDGYNVTLHIDCCLAETGTHDGTEIIIQVASEASVDDAWTTLVAIMSSSGTAIEAVLPNNEAAGQTVISLTNPVTNNFDNDGKFKFMKNNTIANSEIVYQVSNSGDAGDTITILDGLTHAQNTADGAVLFDIDHAKNEVIYTIAVAIPVSASQVRVIFNNNYNATAIEQAVRVRKTVMTGI